jgi:hypothetical protein
MTTVGYIAKAMHDIDDEAGNNDRVRAIVDVPGVGGGVVTVWPSWICQLCPTTVVRRQSTRNGSSILEPRITGHCGSVRAGRGRHRPR